MRKIICVILALFLASSAAFAGYQIFREYTERQESADTYTDLENLISFPEVLPEEEPDETNLSESGETEPAPVGPTIDFAGLEEINEDCVAWIYIEDPMPLDLSRIPDWERFVQAMNYAMMKQFSALEKDGRMAVLMGDIKKKGKLYSMIAEIVKPGTMENIIIKAQHNCFSDNTQYSGTFIPILHEYVLIVRKDSPTAIPVLMCSQKTMDIRDMPGATWRDVVAAVLEECNKAVSLAYLYEQIEPHKKARANQWWKEKIRQTLQCNPEHFDHVGRGLWCIRKSA